MANKKFLDVLQAEGWEVTCTNIMTDDYHSSHLCWEVRCKRGGEEKVYRRVWQDEALSEAVADLISFP